MNISRAYRSPNFDPDPIAVEFLVLHYTACSLTRALQLLCDRERKVSAHFVIDTDGAVYELLNALDGAAVRGWHAGASSYTLAGREYCRFNDFGIGIEIVNLNGNLFAYTEQQYLALVELTKELAKIYPALRDPERIVGHEQIAGFRGKVDPGHCFDWRRYYQAVFPELDIFPARQPALGEQQHGALKKLAQLKRLQEFASLDPMGRSLSEQEWDEIWSGISSLVEYAGTR